MKEFLGDHLDKFLAFAALMIVIGAAIYVAKYHIGDSTLLEAMKQLMGTISGVFATLLTGRLLQPKSNLESKGKEDKWD